LNEGDKDAWQCFPPFFSPSMVWGSNWPCAFSACLLGRSFLWSFTESFVSFLPPPPPFLGKRKSRHALHRYVSTPSTRLPLEQVGNSCFHLVAFPSPSPSSSRPSRSTTRSVTLADGIFFFAVISSTAEINFATFLRLLSLFPSLGVTHLWKKLVSSLPLV